MYIWIKAFHLIFVIALIAGLLIYPRYKMHQLTSKPGEPLFEAMKDAANKLRNIILTPAILMVWVLGLTMLYLNQSLITEGWIHVKLVLVLGLSGLHGYFISLGKKIDRGDENISIKHLKILNELPFIITIAVVILAIVRPF